MKRIHIVGRRNHGKTTLTLEVLQALRARSFRIGTLKHSSHDHDVDTPGKDSYRHREAGGEPAVFVTPQTTGVVLPTPPTGHLYNTLAPFYASCDLVLVEGNIDAPGPKIEVWRAARQTPPLVYERTDITAVVSDDTLPSPLAVPQIPRHNIAALVDHICRTLDLPLQK